MRLEKKHSFSADEALARLQALADYWNRKHGLRFDFTETRATVSGEVKGVKIRAEVHLEPGAIRVEADDPPLLLRAIAKAYVASKLDHFLDPALAVADLRKEASG
jgi:hypothetical protein